MSQITGDGLLVSCEERSAYAPEEPARSTIEAVCAEQGLSFSAMAPVQKFFLTHYRCSFCKMLPLGRLDLAHPTKARCGKCGQLVTFSGAGKYGKMRKKIALTMWASKREKYGVS